MKNKPIYKLSLELNDDSIQVTSIGKLTRKSLVIVLLKIFRALKIKDYMPQEVAEGLMYSVYDKEFQKAIIGKTGVQGEETIIDLSGIRKDDDK